MSTPPGQDVAMEAEESLLYSARHGELKVVKDLLQAKKEGKINLDISCKGKNKTNLGWTPLHLATYFGHIQVVEALLEAGADFDEVNDTGDTALHKAAFIGNEELVILLLKYGADVNIMNGEGRTAADVCKNRDVQRLVEGAMLAERKDKERRLLRAAKEGRVEDIQQLLNSAHPPNINCVDEQGNTSLHCAAYRGHARLAILLLQNGVDTTLRNRSGQLAIDLARDNEMREVLSVRPVQRLQRTAARFEGPLLKRSRFLGWRLVWVVLQRGVLLYYGSRADASHAETRPRTRKYLDSARLTAPDSEPALMVLAFSDGDTHKLAVPPGGDVAATRQKWLCALNEHIEFSGHYLWAGTSPDAAKEATEELNDDCKPLGSMQDALTAVSNLLALLETQLRECAAILAALDRSPNATSLHHSAYMRFQHACGTGQEALSSLKHCAALVAQARDADAARLQREIERNRVLEEALAALARTHHALELSVAEELSKSKRKKNTSSINESKDNFFDVFDASDEEDDTLVTAGLSSPLGALSPWGSSPELGPMQSSPLADASDEEDDTLVTAGLSSPLGALSPWGSSPELRPMQSSPLDDGEKTPTNEDHNLTFRDFRDVQERPLSQSSGSHESLHTALSPASSRGTLVSQGGHVYRNARPYRKNTKPRTSLPVAQFSRGDFSLWSVLKNCVGKELSKITMPVVFNEPLSFLQRMLEYLEYAHLLRMASEQTDPVTRMEYIAAFAVSALASNWERLGKPFNPLLGETYELERPEFRAVCEQVSHHPPISAFHADSPHFVFHGSVHPKLKFCGKSVEIQPKGHVTVELPRWGEAYTWTNVNCCVHNVIVGKLWIEQYGAMEVVCHGGAGLRASLAFRPAGFNNRDLHRVDGFILDPCKKKIRHLYGKWTQYIKCCSFAQYEQWARDSQESSSQTPSHTPKKVLAKLNSFKVGALRSMSIQDPEETEPLDEVPKPDESNNIEIPGSVTLWEARARPPNSAQYYQFTEFAMSLNELDPGMRGQLCPTDSRLRPDVRLLEQGDVDAAATHKQRLEDKQRQARKALKKQDEDWTPRWFSLGTNPYTKQEDWLYNGGYWDRNYEHLKDIDIF